jgi:hypothetical protein
MTAGLAFQNPFKTDCDNGADKGCNDIDPIANAPLLPTLPGPDAAPRIVFINPVVNTVSIIRAFQLSKPGMGTVAPRCPVFPNRALRKKEARRPPPICANRYNGRVYMGTTNISHEIYNSSKMAFKLPILFLKG